MFEIFLVLKYSRVGNLNLQNWIQCWSLNRKCIETFVWKSSFNLDFANFLLEPCLKEVIDAGWWTEGSYRHWWNEHSWGCHQYIGSCRHALLSLLVWLTRVSGTYETYFNPVKVKLILLTCWYWWHIYTDFYNNSPNYYRLLLIEIIFAHWTGETVSNWSWLERGRVSHHQYNMDMAGAERMVVMLSSCTAQ